ncbi:carbohydrate ABC transporter permease [Aureibacillus halotolerans]|uniref:Carbohydrate ABC transporter membrane protein 2 (CUT1 family) n=1 Tax=Aureibacillus halotolerans TaxID=1508390 RepID=A0A4R6U3U0_9BACI|nr:carbohydrate ABC transporter permease [Aureibacillus halotolerans]TDQ39095.1 carbohydrate ABC transporter membrane protein 2 (CUT1 family) [Aureibacillus halotolerans]
MRKTTTAHSSTSAPTKHASLLQKNRDPLKSVKMTAAIVAAIMFVFPIIWMLFVSLKPQATTASLPLDWFLPPYTWVNYHEILFESKVLLWLWNSLYVGVVTTILTLIITSLAAFAISKMKFGYRKFIYVFFLAGMMVPGEATIIPLFEIVKNLELLDTYTGLILPMIASPMGVIILKSFFDGVPDEVIESAQIDGCSYGRLYWSIVLPLAKPALAAIGIFTFIGSWNNFLWPFLSIVTENLYTLPVGIPTFNSNYSQSYVLPMTVNAVASLPVIIAFLLFEKQIVKGVSFTGLKG